MSKECKCLLEWMLEVGTSKVFHFFPLSNENIPFLLYILKKLLSYMWSYEDQEGIQIKCDFLLKVTLKKYLTLCPGGGRKHNFRRFQSLSGYHIFSIPTCLWHYQLGSELPTVKMQALVMKSVELRYHSEYLFFQYSTPFTCHGEDGLPQSRLFFSLTDCTCVQLESSSSLK